MNALIQGTFLGMSSYHSEKKQKDIPQAILYDGEKDNVTIDDVPADFAKTLNFGDRLADIPVKIYSSQYGLRVSYNSQAAK